MPNSLASLVFGVLSAILGSVGVTHQIWWPGSHYISHSVECVIPLGKDLTMQSAHPVWALVVAIDTSGAAILVSE